MLCTGRSSGRLRPRHRRPLRACATEFQLLAKDKRAGDDHCRPADGPANRTCESEKGTTGRHSSSTCGQRATAEPRECRAGSGSAIQSGDRRTCRCHTYGCSNCHRRGRAHDCHCHARSCDDGSCSCADLETWVASAAISLSCSVRREHHRHADDKRRGNHIGLVHYPPPSCAMRRPPGPPHGAVVRQKVTTSAAGDKQQGNDNPRDGRTIPC